MRALSVLLNLLCFDLVSGTLAASFATDFENEKNKLKKITIISRFKFKGNRRKMLCEMQSSEGQNFNQ